MTQGFEIGHALDVGWKRRGKPNQDALGVITPRFFTHRKHPSLVIIADGMGGHTGGEHASKIVVREVKRNFRRAQSRASNYSKTLADVIAKAHNTLIREANKKNHLQDMGTTVVAAVLEENRVSIANVGDSRAYLISDSHVRLISWDHSVVGEQIRQGLLTPEEAHLHPDRNRLTMSLSAARQEIEVFSDQTPLREQDILVLCSDGLWSAVSEAQLQAVVTQFEPQAAADKLVELANANQGPDNISVIVVRRSNWSDEDSDITGEFNLEDTNPGL